MAETITCASGNKYEWAQPPRYVHWRHGRTGQTFFNKVREIAEGDPDGEVSAQERGMRLLENLTEPEGAALERYMSDVLKAGLGYEPTQDKVPEPDYWELFGRAVYGVKGMKVETTEGEMSVETLDTFREEPGLPADGADVSDVRRKRLEEDGSALPAAV